MRVKIWLRNRFSLKLSISLDKAATIPEFSKLDISLVILNKGHLQTTV